MSYTPLSEKSRKNIAKEIESVQHLITLIPQVQEVIKKYDGAEPTTRTINKIRKFILLPFVCIFMESQSWNIADNFSQKFQL